MHKNLHLKFPPCEMESSKFDSCKVDLKKQGKLSYIEDSDDSSVNGPPSFHGVPLAPFAAALHKFHVESLKQERQTWNNKVDFTLSIIGFAVDLSNVWRFPFLCYMNGGGTFLIPYILMLMFGTLPLFYMELIIGQYNHEGPISVWRLCPILKGVGYCSVIVSFYVSFYYNVIIAWALYFLAASFQFRLPWENCDNEWNTPVCYNNSDTGRNDSMSPALEYFSLRIQEIHLSQGMHDLRPPRWEMLSCLLIVYILLYLALFKGVKASGKIVWITATMPYVILLILLIRGILLPGAVDGIKYYLNPDISTLVNTKVWVDAAIQIFYSIGVGFGVHLTYASFNSFKNNCFRDCIFTAVVNSVTSIFAGLVIFTYLGHMSHRQGKPIDKVASQGPGLVFQVYPEAIATLSGSQLWSILFFVLLMMLGIDSGMGGLECVITGILDEFRDFFRKWKFSREVVTALVVTVSFCIAILNITKGGFYVFYWLDNYSAGVSLLTSALFESIGIAWFYGLDRFCQDFKEMLGYKPNLYWRICWKLVSPVFLISIIIFGIFLGKPLSYDNYHYPKWTVLAGWMFSASSVLFIPLYAVIHLLKEKGPLKERIAVSISPYTEHAIIRQTGIVSRYELKHWIQI